MYYVCLYRKKRNCEEGFSTTNNLLKWKTKQNKVYYFRKRRYWIWDTSVPRLLFPFVLYGKNALKITVNNIASQCLALDSRVKSAWVQHKDYVGLINHLASVAQKLRCNPSHKTVQLLNKWGLFRYTEVTPLKTCSYTSWMHTVYFFSVEQF